MRILEIDSTDPLLRETLERAGHQLVEGHHLDRNGILEVIEEYHAIVIRSKFTLDRDFLSKARHLKCIGRFGAGLENIDTDYATKLGINCFNAPEGNRQAVAEHTLTLILAIFNHLKKADLEVRSGTWDRKGNTGLELFGKTVGIIGFGNTGQAFARTISGFNCEVMVCDPYLEDWPSLGQVQVDLPTLLSRSDVISLHVPLTDETRGMVNAEFLGLIKQDALLINTSRGPIVQTTHLLDAIDSGKLMGAGLDVNEFESKSFKLDASENPELSRLLGHAKVLLTPHVGGWTKEAFEKMGLVLAKKMMTVLNQEP